jgi:Ca-activated chloride channel family protein
VVIALLTLLCFGSSAVELVTRGNESFAKGDHQAALEAYLEAMEQDRDNPIIAYNIANTYQRLGDSEAATRFFSQANRANEDEVQAYSQFNRALGFLQQQAYQEAAEEFSDYLFRHPHDLDARRNLEVALKQAAQQQDSSQSSEKGESQENQDQSQESSDGSQSPSDAQDSSDPSSSQPSSQENESSSSSSSSQESEENDASGSSAAEEKGSEQDSKAASEPSQDPASAQEQEQSQASSQPDEEKDAGKGDSSAKMEGTEGEAAKADKASLPTPSEQILQALRQQEEEQQRKFLQRKSKRGNTKVKDW